MNYPFEGRNRITQPWSSGHYGLDIVGDDDKTVRAVCGGKVISSTIITNTSNKTWEWGNYVRIDGNDGRQCFYCHLAKRLVQVGQVVPAGATVGIMGNTGKSYGAHLHLQVRDKAGKELNVAQGIGIPNKVGTYVETAAPASKATLYKLTIGPVSKGDRESIMALAQRLEIKAKVLLQGSAMGLSRVELGPITKGDRAQVEALADKLLVPCAAK